MQISSPAFENYESIPPQYTCDGDGINPPLEFADIPENTKSLALIVDDPDAPIGLFTHWVVANIDPQTTMIRERQVPKGAIEGQNSTGTLGFIPPCPPEGLHHYRFQLFALSGELDMNSGDTRDEIETAMSPLVIARAELVGIYMREYPEVGLGSDSDI